MKFFKTDKNEFEYDEEITFKWKTINADKVSIRPFGQVNPIGEKTYKIKDYKNPYLKFEITAENSIIEKKASETLVLYNITYQN